MNFLEKNFKWIVMLLIALAVCWVILKNIEYKKEELQIRQQTELIKERNDSLVRVKIITLITAENLKEEIKQEKEKINKIKVNSENKKKEIESKTQDETDKLIYELLK